MSCSRERIAKLRAACAGAGIDAFYARNTSDIRWLTAFDGVFDEERAHALMVARHAVKMHTDSRYAEAARRAAHVAGGVVEIDDARTTHAKFAICEAGIAEEYRDDAAAEFVLGIEDELPLREYRALEQEVAEGAQAVALRETDGFVQRLRAVKDADEIARMREAQAVTDAAFAHIVTFVKPGMTEREVQIELDDFMRRNGAEGLAFPSIVATGANGASPHAIPGATRLEAGQCVVMDFGARAAGYCSDMTRTVFLGQPSARMRDAYEAICAANEQVEALLVPGITGKQAHELAEKVLAAHGLEGKMGHALGHGVGIDIHEEPTLSPRNDEPLVEGNVVTVEPGVYLPGEFGMRLEDFGVITADGFDVFTKSSHEMVIL